MPKKLKSSILPEELIQNKIFLIRGKKVMLDRDLAELYNLSTKRLNEQVKRNKSRFPVDFMFQLNPQEQRELVAKCDRFRTLKHATSNAFAFSENGVAMLSSVLNSEIAIQVNIQIMRTFVKLKKMMASEQEIHRRLTRHDIQLLRQGKEILNLADKVRFILNLPVTLKRKPGKIGFHPPEK